ncbi:hypothetical protein GLOTRDRAFT_97038 [Gloeophyllum trabeum ATCC 11539]|uniref:Uncharacterized protein n=1 Tax=Gloeophyllum trabeum (strain ATCC 11539 / FP-39264 / Madison 617) TaxID=670483 RepID=S7PSR5_GLOTA|nr:uncharacterized protein GLOTRDRAFT_97038 [Gloeophyllum trabeum ATCC 11539]EPQ50422.1 hypothetical protein GLOTRDRAFT_97038 [Gloeophyllum trabeum ATCC 11539]
MHGRISGPTTWEMFTCTARLVGYGKTVIKQYFPPYVIIICIAVRVGPSYVSGIQNRKECLKFKIAAESRSDKVVRVNPLCIPLRTSARDRTIVGSAKARGAYVAVNSSVGGNVLSAGRSELGIEKGPGDSMRQASSHTSRGEEAANLHGSRWAPVFNEKSEMMMSAPWMRDQLWETEPKREGSLGVPRAARGDFP